MKVTDNVRAIVLRRVKFRENDSRITVYSLERGLIELVVRGTSRPKSKLAGHIEPMNLVNIMIVPGKRMDYAGSVVSENCFLEIKNDLEKVETVGQVFRVFNKIVKLEETDENLFFLLLDFLLIVNSGTIENKDLEFFKHLFIYKFLHLLGHGAELEVCVECKRKIENKNNFFDYNRGGVICCVKEANQNGLTITPNCVKVLRLLSTNNMIFISKIKTNSTLNNEIIRIIKHFYKYVIG